VFAPRPQSAITKRAFVGESNGGGWGAGWKFNVVSTRDDKRRRAQRQREGEREERREHYAASREAYTYIFFSFLINIHRFQHTSVVFARRKIAREKCHLRQAGDPGWLHVRPGWSRKMIGCCAMWVNAKLEAARPTPPPPPHTPKQIERVSRRIFSSSCTRATATQIQIANLIY
jgi:hypothetical protein